MGKKKEEPFTKLPNRVLRSQRFGPYEKLVYWALSSCNPSFPSYEVLMEWTGLSRERVWKSLRKLEEVGLIIRYRNGRSTLYDCHFNRSPDELINAPPVRYTNSTSSPDELEPVRQTNSKKTK